MIILHYRVVRENPDGTLTLRSLATGCTINDNIIPEMVDTVAEGNV